MSVVATGTVQDLLTEKLRPKKFEQIILSDRVKNSLNNGEIQQNMLFYGMPGTGKTSTAKVLSLKAMGHDEYYINCSDETGVDIIRDKITEMCMSVSVLDGNYAVKVIILDEIDGVSEQFFKALRGTMEKFTNCRFIATTNYINKIPEAIQSRFECVNFDFVNKDEEEEVKSQWKERVEMVLDKLVIDRDDTAIDEFVKRYFPDMRKALNKIQNFSHQKINKLTAENIRQLSWDFQDLYVMLMKTPEPFKNYEFVMANYAGKVEDVMNAFGSEFIEWLKDKHPDKQQMIPGVLVTVADYQSKRHLVIDPVVSLLALVFSIQKMMSTK